MTEELQSIRKEVESLPGVSDVQESTETGFRFTLDGYAWAVYQVHPSAENMFCPFILLKNGQRVFGFVQAESIRNFFLSNRNANRK